MMHPRLLFVLALTLPLLAAQTPPEQTPPQLPPGHPPMQPTLPSGHPSIGATRPNVPSGPATANPEDVATVDGLIRSYYESISGPAGQDRDWNRFRSLFLPQAKLITTRPAGNRSIPFALTPDEYVRANDTYFSRGGYFEREVHRTANQYGAIAQAFSTYASRRTADAPEPYSRGINSFQLLHDGQRWWIISMTWDYERPGETPIPAEFGGEAS